MFIPNNWLNISAYAIVYIFICMYALASCRLVMYNLVQRTLMRLCNLYADGLRSRQILFGLFTPRADRYEGKFI